MSKHYHPFHIVDPSPWPYVGAVGCLGMTTGGVMYMHSYQYGDLLLFSSITIILLVMIVWWRDVIREATFQGHHTLIVQRGLKWGMLLFILSEVCFFFSFFWAIKVWWPWNVASRITSLRSKNCNGACSRVWYKNVYHWTWK